MLKPKRMGQYLATFMLLLIVIGLVMGITWGSLWLIAKIWGPSISIIVCLIALALLGTLRIKSKPSEELTK